MGCFKGLAFLTPNIIFIVLTDSLELAGSEHSFGCFLIQEEKKGLKSIDIGSGKGVNGAPGFLASEKILYIFLDTSGTGGFHTKTTMDMDTNIDTVFVTTWPRLNTCRRLVYDCNRPLAPTYTRTKNVAVWCMMFIDYIETRHGHEHRALTWTWTWI